MDDVLALSRIQMETSPTWRRYRIRVELIWPIVFIVAGIIVAVTTGRIKIAITIWVIAGVWIIVMPAYTRWHQARFARSRYSESSNEGLFGIHELTASDAGLDAVSPDSQAQLQWRAIERVETTPEYALIYLAASSVIVIPRHRIHDGDFDEFISLVRRHTGHVADGE